MKKEYSGILLFIHRSAREANWTEDLKKTVWLKSIPDPQVPIWNSHPAVFGVQPLDSREP